MLDLTGELELGLMEEDVFWNINKSSINKKKERKEEGKEKAKTKKNEKEKN